MNHDEECPEQTEEAIPGWRAESNRARDNRYKSVKSVVPTDKRIDPNGEAQSVRIAVIGSTDAARRAGTALAMRATITMAADIAANTGRSSGVSP